jgi:hypothetical protein
MEYAANAGGAPATPDPTYNFLNATSGDCADGESNAMCYYANLNGYSSKAVGATVASNDVSWNTSTIPPVNAASSSAIVNGATANGVPAYLNVTVTENVPVTFMGIFAKAFRMSNSWQTVQVVGHCNCGLVGGAQTSAPGTLPTTTVTQDCNDGVGSGSGYACGVFSAAVALPSSPVESGAAVTMSVTGSLTSTNFGGGGMASLDGYALIGCGSSAPSTCECNNTEYGGYENTDTIVGQLTGLNSASNPPPPFYAVCYGVTNTDQIKAEAYASAFSLGGGGDTYTAIISLTAPDAPVQGIHVATFGND